MNALNKERADQPRCNMFLYELKKKGIATAIFFLTLMPFHMKDVSCNQKQKYQIQTNPR